MAIARRSFITGLISLVAAPAIVRAGSLMPVRVMLDETIFVPVGFEVWADFAEIRRQMMRDYIHANLFHPYLGSELGSAPKIVYQVRQ